MKLFDPTCFRPFPVFRHLAPGSYPQDAVAAVLQYLFPHADGAALRANELGQDPIGEIALECRMDRARLRHLGGLKKILALLDAASHYRARRNSTRPSAGNCSIRPDPGGAARFSTVPPTGPTARIFSGAWMANARPGRDRRKSPCSPPATVTLAEADNPKLYRKMLDLLRDRPAVPGAEVLDKPVSAPWVAGSQGLPPKGRTRGQGQHSCRVGIRNQGSLLALPHARLEAGAASAVPPIGRQPGGFR